MGAVAAITAIAAGVVLGLSSPWPITDPMFWVVIMPLSLVCGMGCGFFFSKRR